MAPAAPLPAASPPPAGQATLTGYVGNQVTEGIGSDSDRIADARAAARTEGDIAGADRAFRGNLLGDLGRITSIVNPLLASPSPADQARARDYLSQSTSPPARFADTYRELGLNTNQNVLDRAPEYAKNLEESASQREQNANYLNDQANKGEAAARALKNMNRSIEDRLGNYSSLDPNAPLTGKSGDPNAKIDSSLARTPGSRLAKADPSADGSAARPPATSRSQGATDRGGFTQANGESTIATTSKGVSLKDRLKQSLAGGTDAGSKKEIGDGKSTSYPTAEPKSAFDSLFADKDSSAEDPNASRNARGNGFQMAGSETDAAVRRLLASGLGPNGGNATDDRVFGSSDVTIFKRMSKFLEKAQVEKRVTSR